jgi:glycosyltransferase involved in cell wall biosynthesis
LLTVIVPSHNEENHIGACLEAVLAQEDLPPNHKVQIIVAGNGCQDRTVEIAKGKVKAFNNAGFILTVLDIEKGNKMNALNKAEAVASYQNRAFVDADVVIGPRILRELADILAQDTPLYASGTVAIPRPKSFVSRAYAKVWTNLPFVHDGVSGIGLYAVNGKGRARWAAFPPIYSDDRFVRLQFAPNERRKTKATYAWPLPEGLRNLLNVRHRWSEGNMELVDKYADLIANDSERNNTVCNAVNLLRTPVSSGIFVFVFLIGNLRAKKSKGSDGFIWRRGRD